MSITLDKTIWEIAREWPSSVEVFEALRIDYHGRRRKTLNQVCVDLGLSGPQLLHELEKARAETLREPGESRAKANSAGL
jgi:hypothetical protein